MMSGIKYWIMGAMIFASVVAGGTGLVLMGYTTSQKEQFVSNAKEQMEYFYEQTDKGPLDVYEAEKILKVAKYYFDQAIAYGASPDDPLYVEINTKLDLYQKAIKERERIAQSKSPLKLYDRLWFQIDTGFDKYRTASKKYLGSTKPSMSKH